jgi:hypothetical protein
MPTEKTITLYTYDELSDRAKETARQWWLEGRDSSDYHGVTEDFATIVKLMGFDLTTHSVRLMNGSTREEPNIWWSLGYCQSDFAGFEARYSYAKGGAAAVKDYAPKDETLHAIAASLQEMQKRNFWQISAKIRFDDRRGYEIAEVLKDGCYMYGSDAEDDAESVIREACKDLSRWLYARLREEDEYLSSDEHVADAMEANEYTFREDGTRED